MRLLPAKPERCLPGLEAAAVFGGQGAMVAWSLRSARSLRSALPASPVVDMVTSWVLLPSSEQCKTSCSRAGANSV